MAQTDVVEAALNELARMSKDSSYAPDKCERIAKVLGAEGKLPVSRQYHTIGDKKLMNKHGFGMLYPNEELSWGDEEVNGFFCHACGASMLFSFEWHKGKYEMTACPRCGTLATDTNGDGKLLVHPVHIYTPGEYVEGVDTSTFSSWLCGKLGVEVQSFNGRGFQHRANVEALRKHFGIETEEVGQ